MLSFIKGFFCPKPFCVGHDKKGREVYVGDIVYSPDTDNRYCVAYNKERFSFFLKAEQLPVPNNREQLALIKKMIKVKDGKEIRKYLKENR